MSMDEFYDALLQTIDNEGGYRLHTVEGDLGGQTYAGISRNNHPGWAGWDYDLRGPLTSTLERIVRNFYKNEFWDKIRGDEIYSHSVGACLFDFAVNTGVNNAIKCIQESAGGIQADGIMGPITLGRINAYHPAHLISQFRLAKIQYYTDIVDRSPDQIKFLVGWVRRALRA